MFFIAAILCVLAIGYLSQRTGLCMVRGMLEARQGQPVFLLAILGSGVLVWVAGLAAAPFNLAVPFRSFHLSVWALLGGFLFGAGAFYNSGCGVSTISKLARGHMAMLATITGWVAGWILLSIWMVDAMGKAFRIPAQWHYAALIVLSVLSLIFAFRLPKEKRTNWLGMMGIGLLAGVVFIYQANWPPSGLLKGISLAVWSADQELWPRQDQYLFVGVLILGMFIAALQTRSFRLEVPGFKAMVTHLLAGLLMGIGAAIANGGNDSQLLLALPAFSPAGFGTVLSILAGIYLADRLQGIRVR